MPVSVAGMYMLASPIDGIRRIGFEGKRVTELRVNLSARPELRFQPRRLTKDG